MTQDKSKMWWKDGPHDEQIKGGVKITRNYWETLLGMQSQGHHIVSDETGYPIAVPAPGPTEEEVRQMEIAELKSKLATTDWVVIKCSELGISVEAEYPAVYTERKSCRQRINDLEKVNE